jgi:hypothetical protein
MNQGHFRGRVRRFPAIVLAVLGAGLIFSQSAPAFAQSAECDALKGEFATFTKLIGQAQAIGKRKVGPDQACSIFTKLQSTQASLVPMLEKDGAWCHVPDPTIAGVKQQTNPIAKAKADSCAAAVKFKQMEAQARKQQQQRQQGAGPLGGGDSIVGGPVKMPQGAL